MSRALFDLVVPCVDVCGAPIGALCRDERDRPLATAHVSRRRRAERHVDEDGNGERARGADLLAIEAGCPSLQEIARDSWADTLRSWPAEPRTIKAWRVACACATLDKVYGGRAAPIFSELILRYPTPFALLLAPAISLYALFGSLGLRTKRTHGVRLASEKAIHEPAQLGRGVGYEAQAIRLVVDGDASFEPDDKVLRAVRARVLRERGA